MIFWMVQLCTVYQTQYGDTSSQVGVTFKKIFQLLYQAQGHSEGWYNQNKLFQTLKPIYWTADLVAAKLSLMVHHKPVLWKDWISVFKVRDTAKVQNFIECVSVLCFRYHWSDSNQVRCVDVLLLITKRDANLDSMEATTPRPQHTYTHTHANQRTASTSLSTTTWAGW